jgi:hypothetical protein
LNHFTVPIATVVSSHALPMRDDQIGNRTASPRDSAGVAKTLAGLHYVAVGFVIQRAAVHADP